VAVSDDRTQTTERQPTTSPPGDVVAMLRVALDGLPGQQRTAIRLAMVEQLTVPNIAARIGASMAEVMDAMRDGLYALRDVLAVVDPTTTDGSGPPRA